jgi:hypothetical protein
LASRCYADEEGFETDPAELQAATEAYRYKHDLTTVDETERWLEDHGLTLDDFTAYLELQHWLQRFTAQRSEIGLEYAPDGQQVNHLIWSQVAFARHFESLAQELAWRVAASREDKPAGAASCWPEELIRMEACYKEHRSRMLTEEKCRLELEARRLYFLRFEVGIAAFASENPAREAFLCVTEDGDSLEEAARRAGGGFEQRTDFLDGLPPALRAAALSSAPGDTLSPSHEDGAYRVYRFYRKIEPTLGDPEVCSRVEEEILNLQFADLVRKHIVWEARPGRTP